MTKKEFIQKITLVTGLFIIHACLITLATTSRKPVAIQPSKQQSVTVHLLAEPSPLYTQPLQLLPISSEPVSKRQPEKSESALEEKHSASDLKNTEPDTTTSSLTDVTGTYLPSSLMDRRPIPVSEPDMQMVRSTLVSGQAVRLRIFVDHLGNVVEVSPLSSNPLDSDFVEDVIAMFRATAFLPGQRAGEDVGSYLDIELTTQPNIPLILPASTPNFPESPG